ncbi:MAG: BREX system serine/threonine kinase PglW [Ramlibacter sp.]
MVAESNFAWEREALEWLREQLPDRDPWHVWTTFEFIDDEGRVNEVDALVLSPAGLFLVEIKSRPGTLDGDTHTWTWQTDGRTTTVDNPLRLTDRKAKRLASLLRRQQAVIKAKIRVPFVEPVVFLSSTSLNCKLQGLARSGTFLRGRPTQDKDDGIVAALRNGLRPTNAPPVDSAQVRAIFRGIEQAGIRQSNKHRQVGDYKLVKLITEGDGYQDWLAQHVSLQSNHRRIRIFTVTAAASPAIRTDRMRQAEREFEILEGIDHPGILRVLLYTPTELGPALTYDYDPQAQRLDHLLRDQGARLTVSQRLQLVRDIGEVLRYAHSKRLYHRGLGPQSILVSGMDAGPLRVRIMNWQTASRGGSSVTTIHRTTGTEHVEAYVEDLGLLYLAPETVRADPAHGAELDVFSLGCIAYQVFSGQLPAESPLEMDEKLRAGPGLRLSDVLDGCGPRLQDLVQFATIPDVSARTESMATFLMELDGVEDELTTPDPEATVDPSTARANDRIEGGFTVVRRLGRGSSSDALLVREDGSEATFVLKVATDIAHNEHLVAEGEALGQLRHPNIVVHRRTLQVAGRTALLLDSAGDTTLAEEKGRLPLQMLQRYGEELIDAVRHLEDRGVTHRDIKPDNIGLARASNGRLLAVLFDFSLSRTPPENLTAGTLHYLDPFLAERPRRMWDLYAERYALAVTLYEMTIGRLPRWGDGRTSPGMLDPGVEVSLAAEALPPAVREPLAAFFAKALKRDFRQRFDNAEDMLREWRRVFERSATVHPIEPTGFDAVASVATPGTTMAELGYSVEAQDVLDRMAVHNARELLAVDRIRFRYLKGVGDKVRREIREKAKRLAELRPDLTPGRTTLHDEADQAVDSEEASVTERAISINELAGLLLPKRPAADDRVDDAALAHYLGIERSDTEASGSEASAAAAATPSMWSTRGEAAVAAGIDRTAFADALVKARERWLKTPAFTDLRAQIAALLEAQGHVMTAQEAALAILALRGCALQQDDERLRMALAVLRAAVEAEAHTSAPRFQAYDQPPTPLLATDAPWAEYARQLGAAADACALAEPLLPPARVLQALEAVPAPVTEQAFGGGGEGVVEPSDFDDGAVPVVPALPAPRMLRLAASASRHAALSSRQELYPRGMSALLALRQSMGALVNVPALKVDKLRQRVRGRYPEAAPLPDRPALDRLLEEAGVPLEWNQATDDGTGAYTRLASPAELTVGPTTLFSRQPTHDGSVGPSDTALAEALALEQRLQRHLTQGGLLTLTCEPRLAARAESEVLHRFGPDGGGMVPLRRMSVDAFLLQELRQQASAARVDWNRVLGADAAERDSRDWTNLQRLVQRALPALKNALLSAEQSLLVVNVGLLARYDLLSLITELEAAAGRPGQTFAAWLLLPTRQAGRAAIDGIAVPLVHASNVVAMPQAWIENRHRTQAEA